MSQISQHQRSDAGARLTLTNGRFADVVRGCYFPPGTRVVIENGRIEAVCAPGDSAGAALDLHGKAVIPGLFNTHCHIQIKYPSLLPGLGDAGLARQYGRQQIEKSMADCLACGITHVRDALTTDLRPNRALGDRIGRGDLAGPRIHHSVLVSQMGGTYTSAPSLFDRLMSAVAGSRPVPFDSPHSGIVAFPAEAGDQAVRDAVDRAIDERGAECVKLYDQREYVPSYAPGASLLTERQLQAAADQARKRGVVCTLHHTNAESLRRGLRAGVTSLAHLPCDEPLGDADVAAFAGSGILLEPTMTLAYYLSWPLPGAPWNNHPRLAALSAFRDRTCAALAGSAWLPEMAASARSMFDKLRLGRTKLLGVIDLSAVFRYYGAMISHGADNLARLVEAGARIACGNDAGAAPAAESMAQHELEMLGLVLNAAPARFSGAAALRAATLHSAQALGVDRSFGSIEPGKVADLVVLDGDPLAEPRLIGSRAAAVFVAGRLVIGHPGQPAKDD